MPEDANPADSSGRGDAEPDTVVDPDRGAGAHRAADADRAAGTDPDVDADSGASPGAGASVDRRSPEDVFALLANDTRVAIVRALGETPDEAQSFADLHDRVDVADSGNFNYHLQELQPAFVREDDGYELTHAGKQVVGAIHAGTYTADGSLDPLDLDWDCLLCGGSFEATYDGERVHIECADCGDEMTFSFPPGALTEFDRDELPGAFARWIRLAHGRSAAGFCHVCSGRLHGELARLPREDEDGPKPTKVRFTCERCGGVAAASGAGIASVHPVVEGFLFEQGFDTRAAHASQVWGQLDEFYTTIRSADPPRVAVHFGHDGERVTAEIGPDGAVDDVERTQVD